MSANTSDLDVLRQQRDEWKAEALRLRERLAAAEEAVDRMWRSRTQTTTPREAAARDRGCTS